MSVDIALLITILMKNEDVWLKIPSEELFNQAVEVLRMTGVNLSTDGNCKLRINSPEMAEKIRQEQEEQKLTRKSLFAAQAQLLQMQKEYQLKDFERELWKTYGPPPSEDTMQAISTPAAPRSLFDKFFGRES